MNPFLAAGLYLGVIISILQSWLIPAVGFAILFSLKYSSAFLIPAAIMIDAYYGAFYSVPVLSFVALAWFLIFETVKPRFIDFK